MATESDPIKGSDLVDPSSLAPAIAEAEAYIATLQKLKATVNDLSDSGKKMAAGVKLGDMPNSAEGLKQHASNLKVVNDAERIHNSTKMASVAIDKQLIETQVALNAAKAKYRNEVKDNLALAGAEKDSITAMSIELKKVTQEWNALSKAEAADPTNAVTKRKTELTATLSKLRQATGDHRMEVGKYAKSLQGLTGILHIFGEALGIDREALEGLRATHSALREGLRDTHHLMEGVITKHVEGTAAAEAQTAANEAEGASWLAALGPLGAFIAIIGVAAGAIALYTMYSRKALEEEKEHSKAVDGSIILDKKLRDTYNETTKTLEEVSNGYKVLSGEISETDAVMAEATMNYKIKLSEIDNETTEKLQHASGFWHMFGNALKDTFTGKSLGASTAEEMIEIAQATDIQTKAAQAQLKKAQEADLAARIDAHKKRFEEEVQFNKRMRDLRNENTKDQLNREIEAINAERSAQLKLVDIKTTGDAGADALAKARIEEEANQRIANVQKKFNDESIQRNYDYLVKLAQLSGDKEVIAKAEYEKELFDLNLNLVAKHASEEESLKERKLLWDKYQQDLLEIQDERRLKDKDILLKEDSDIRNTYERELATANDTYDKEVIQLEIAFRKKLITQEQYQKQSEDLAKEHEQKLQDIANKALEKNLNDLAQKASLQTKADQIKHSKPGVIQADEVAAENARWKAEWQKMVDNADTTYQEMENAYQDHQNRINEIAQQAAEARAKIQEKLEQDILSALSSSLTAQNQLQEDGLKAQQEMLASNAEAEAQLAAAGRKNTLAQIQKAESDNAEAQMKAQRQLAREKKAEALAELFIQADTAFIKGGSNPMQAAFQAIQSVTLAKGISDGFAGAFFKGVADTGGPGRLDDKGGKLAILHPHEAVIPRHRNEQYPGLAQAWIDGKLDSYILRMTLPVMPKEKSSDDRMLHKLSDIENTMIGVKDAIVKKEESLVYKIGHKTIIERRKNGFTQIEEFDDPSTVRLI